MRKTIIPHTIRIILLSFCFLLQLSNAQNGESFKVVIDAGHGGKDTGCTAHHTDEKDISLLLALELGRKIEAYHHDVEVVYTRETDVFIPLFKRVELANKSGADLFLSIHCNYLANPSAKGIETYVMGVHRADENLQVAIRENASILMEKNFQYYYGGYDPETPESHIILSLYQDSYLDQSIDMASKIGTSFEKRTILKNRGVKQAGFVVLRQASMPSILIEAGFLSNPKDAKYLKSKEGQDEITDAIAIAFIEYKKLYLTANHPLLSESVDKQINNTNLDNRDSPITVTAVVQEKEIVVSQQATNTIHDIPPSLKQQPSTKIFRVQIAATKNQPLNTSGSMWESFTDLEVLEEDGFYKYLIGQYTSLTDAITAKTNAKELGFNGAFIVAYIEKERVNNLFHNKNQ